MKLFYYYIRIIINKLLCSISAWQKCPSLLKYIKAKYKLINASNSNFYWKCSTAPSVLHLFSVVIFLFICAALSCLFTVTPVVGSNVCGRLTRHTLMWQHNPVAFTANSLHTCRRLHDAHKCQNKTDFVLLRLNAARVDTHKYSWYSSSTDEELHVSVPTQQKGWSFLP